MAYTDRLREPKYTSPSGKEFAFDLRTVERELGKKTSIHELAGQDEIVTQESGKATKPFTVQAIFHGETYDTQADAFAEALVEPGNGELVHPRWGVIKVLTITAKQTEGLVEGMRQSVVEVQFIRAGNAVGAASTLAKQVGIKDQLTAPAALADISPESAADVAKVKSLATVTQGQLSGLKKITGAAQDLTADINAYAAKVTDAIDNFVADPLALGSALITLIGAPASAATSIYAKVTGYFAVLSQYGQALDNALGAYVILPEGETIRSSLDDALSGLPDVPTVGTPAQAGLMVNVNVGVAFGVILATTEGESPANRSAALATSQSLQNTVTTVMRNIEALEAQVPGFVAPVETLLQLKQATRDALDALLGAAVSLPVERRKVLEGARSPVELAWELYGNPDEWERVITENGLTGRQILEVGAGTEVVWYQGGRA